MNSFNRALVLLLALLLTAGAVLVLLITFGAIAPAQVIPVEWAETALGRWFISFATLPPPATLIVTLVAATVVLLSLLVVWYEVRPTAQAHALVIREDGVGRVTVEVASVRNLIVYSAAQLPHVLQVQPTIQQSTEGLTILCRTSFSTDAVLPQVTRELQDRIKQEVEKHTGMRVVAVLIQAQLEPLAGGMTYQPRPAHRVLR